MTFSSFFFKRLKLRIKSKQDHEKYFRYRLKSGKVSRTQTLRIFFLRSFKSLWSKATENYFEIKKSHGDNKIMNP